MGLLDRPLSRQGNEVMPKAVIQDIPVYVMSCFMLPVSTCEQMRKAIANQWWGFEDGKKKMHWRSWDWLSTPKSLGGMGFRDMELFNQAMLGRQCWRLITDPSSLCARVLQEHYYPNGDFLEAACPRSASYTWRSILHGRKLIEKGIRWGVGDVTKVKIMEDYWIPGHRPFMLKPLVPLVQGQTVSSLLAADARSWNELSVCSIFVEDVAEKVLQILISRFGGDDFVMWPHTHFGIYSIRSAYHLARRNSVQVSRSACGRGTSSDSDSDSNLWNKLWSIQAPGKMQITLWWFAHDCLPTGVQLQHRNIPASPECIHCAAEERVDHAFLFCPFARHVWDVIRLQRIHNF
jgi:hypothetical protein